MESAASITGRIKQKLASEGDDLTNEDWRCPETLKLREVTCLDLLESLKDSLFLAKTLFIKGLLVLRHYHATPMASSHHDFMVHLHLHLLLLHMLHLVQTGTSFLGTFHSFSFSFESELLGFEFGVAFGPLTLPLLNSLHDFGEFSLFNGDFTVSGIYLLSISLRQGAIRDLAQFRSVPIITFCSWSACVGD